MPKFSLRNLKLQWYGVYGVPAYLLIKPDQMFIHNGYLGEDNRQLKNTLSSLIVVILL